MKARTHRCLGASRRIMFNETAASIISAEDYAFMLTAEQMENECLC